MGQRTEKVWGPSYDISRNRWRITIRRSDGARVVESFASEAAALRAKRAIEEAVALTAGRTIAKTLVEYKAHLQRKGGKEGSIADTIWKVGRLFPDHRLPLASLRSKDDGKRLYRALLDYISPQTKKPYAADSQRNMLIEARTFLRWAVDENYLKVNVFDGISGFGKRRKGKDKVQLTRDEARAFRDYAIYKAKRGCEGAIAALVALYMDMRAGEIVMRERRDLDDGGELLIVRDAKTTAGERRLEVGRRLQPLLRRLARGKAPTEYLFGDGKKPRDVSWVRKWAKKICKAAGVPEVDAHGLRRTHATLTARTGATAEMLELAMGHESFETTKESYIARGTMEGMRRQGVADILDFEERRGPRRASRSPSEIQRKVND